MSTYAELKSVMYILGLQGIDRGNKKNICFVIKLNKYAYDNGFDMKIRLLMHEILSRGKTVRFRYY